MGIEPFIRLHKGMLPGEIGSMAVTGVDKRPQSGEGSQDITALQRFRQRLVNHFQEEIDI